MDYKDEKIKIKLPGVAQMQAHKRRLKIALLTKHQRQSKIHAFIEFIIDLKNNMSLGKKSTVAATVIVFGLIVVAGTFGPTASEVAQAEAANTVKRAFARFVNLTDEEKVELEERFQDRVHFRDEGGPRFRGINEMTNEEREARHEEIKASLADSLAEAQSAEDLEVISADEMPVDGFFGRAGRAFGLKMMRPCDENIENLPEEIQEKIKEHAEVREEMEPVKFLRYTNADEKQVTIGLNTDDDPVVKFVEGEMPPMGHGGPDRFGGLKGHVTPLSD